MDVRRPRFLIGTTKIRQRVKNARLPLPIRALTQGTRIPLRGFRIPDPVGRRVLGAADFETQRLQREGVKIAFSEQALKDLVNVKIPVLDKHGVPITDADGNPILRSIVVDADDLKKSFEDKIDILQQQLTAGFAKTEEGRMRLVTMLLSMKTMVTLSGSKRAAMVDIVRKVGFNPITMINDLTGKIHGRYLGADSLREGNNRIGLTMYCIAAADVSNEARKTTTPTPGLPDYPIPLTQPVEGVRNNQIYLDSVITYLGANAGAVIDVLQLRVHKTIDEALVTWAVSLPGLATPGPLPVVEGAPGPAVEEVKLGDPTDIDDLLQQIGYTPGDPISDEQLDALATLNRVGDVNLIDELRLLAPQNEGTRLGEVLKQIRANLF